MRVIVLGAGVVGVTTAWYLSQAGHTVSIIDQAGFVGSGTSFANAGQLSYSFTDALARPGFLGKLPALMCNRDPAIRFQARPSRDFMRWGLSFLRQCTSARSRANTVAVLKIAMHSSKLMDELLNQVPLDFSFREAGKLVLLTSDGELLAARRSAQLKQQHGCRTDILALQEALRIEPALAYLQHDIKGAIWSADDKVGDAHAFAANLAAWMERNAEVTCRLGEQVTAIRSAKRTVTGVTTSHGEHDADAVVVSLGCGSTALLRGLGIPANIWPVRGYSVTLPLGEHAPSTSISDVRHRMVFSRIGNQMRIAGFADFIEGHSLDDRARADKLLELARRTAPQAAQYDVGDVQAWGAWRPMTPDSRPLVGPTRVNGLYLNTGHGMLGWTLACATGHAVAEAIGRA
ncbi:MAG TPA: FAD-dependent oxidoreductase [Woeseiaceae bacterium]